jgi:hypothetical protein
LAEEVDAMGATQSRAVTMHCKKIDDEFFPD